MADQIQSIFLTPALSIARLGGSTTPQDAYRWAETPNPRSNGETVVVPDWSLKVQADGTVIPELPAKLSFRDAGLIRPVAPFIELWAMLGEPGSDPSTWTPSPLTPTVLSAHAVTLSDVVVRITAINAKVARRMGNPDLRFGTFPPVEIRADNQAVVQLLGISPPGVNRSMIPLGRSVPLGSVQIIRSRQQPASGTTPWADIVNIEVLRLRVTPARGHFYGPPQAAQAHPTPRGDSALPVEPSRAFLDPAAGWFNAEVNPPDAPGDTYDGADVGNNRSLGVIDDTCEMRIEVQFALPNQGNRSLDAAATVFVAPPDFAPDRRPFLSLADELNDRAADANTRSAAMSAAERDMWVEDLFERIYETASLFNLDFWRQNRGSRLSGSQLAPAIPEDATPQPTMAFGGRDALRNRMFPLSAPSTDNPLPLSHHARMRHRDLSDIQALRDLVQQNKGRLLSLIRQPFEIRTDETFNATTMAMPPLMRNSNAEPLTLAVWQYQLLMQWVRETEQASGPIGTGSEPIAAPMTIAEATVPPALSNEAANRRDAVLRRVGDGGLA